MKNFDVLKRFYNQYTKRHLKKIFIAVFFSVMVAGSTSSIAWLLDPAIEKLFINKDQTLIYLIPIFIVVAFATKGLSLYTAKVLLINVAEEVKKSIQSDMIKALIKSDTKFIESKHSGKYISNLNFDVELIKNVLSINLLNLIKDSLTLCGLLGVMFYQNWKLSLVAIIMIPLASIAAKSLGKRMGKVSTQAQERSGFLNKHLVEIFKNHKLIKIFQKENFESNRSDELISNLANKVKKINTVYVRSTPIMETLTGIMIAFLIFYSGRLIMSEELEINNFFSFLAAMMLAYQPVRSLATLNIGIQQGISAGKRIIPILDIKNEITNKEECDPIKLSKGEIVFNNVNFSYLKDAEQKTLKSVNISIEGGKISAFVGHSGAGKSTLLNLIPRFYDPDSGEIKIDNQSIHNVKLKSLRENISIVSQDTTLFDDTVINNIKYANLDATDNEVFEAAELAYATEFISKLKDGYNTVIGENGVRLSGGEKQRLSIARAILKKTKIILLDEATSSLDAETESKIQKAINHLTKDKTSLIIAHRLSTILNSDKIFVLDQGQVIDQGNHDDLIKKSIIYKNFYEKQLRKD
jgi:subfamily B ATP-binding cassette protein MsbA|tara:strand:- start:2053 stop:3795 length:1743 start_codon:yes stop_codon:yes gene_type:complete